MSLSKSFPDRIAREQKRDGQVKTSNHIRDDLILLRRGLRSQRRDYLPQQLNDADCAQSDGQPPTPTLELDQANTAGNETEIGGDGKK